MCSPDEPPELFPACAGVILCLLIFRISFESFPRVCGGDPGTDWYDNEDVAFSPRVRG